MIAVVIPYRDRLQNLNRLLPVLKRYVSPRWIFVAEQVDSGPFGKSLLNNGMFANIPPTQLADMSDVIFHDVDMIPLVWNISPCENFAHLATGISEWHKDGVWSLPYQHYIGGSIMVTKDAYVKLNGFDNAYRGWGCEDDDFIYNYLANSLRLGLATYNQAASGFFERRSGILYHIPHARASHDRFDHNRAILKRRSAEKYAPEGHDGLSAQSAELVEVTTINECQHYKFKLPAPK